MKQPIPTNPMSGFMELLPQEQIVFNQMFDIIRKSYELFGFAPLDTPVLERSEVLLAKAGGETEKQIYRFTKGDNDISMRFDHTVPFARYVVENYGKIIFPFRRYVMGKVYRGERPQAGRFREFYQCDIDVVDIDTLDLGFDAEIPSIIYYIFKKLGFEHFTIKINNRKIFNGFLNSLNLSDKAPNIMQAIDHLEKTGESNVRKELEDAGLPINKIEALFQLISIKGTVNEMLNSLQSLNTEDDQFKTGVNELSIVTQQLNNLGVPSENFKIDLSIARGLDYYTGTVYETTLDEYPEIGSVCSGGRYDNLASNYTDKRIPGVGISIGLTRLFDRLYKKGIIKTKSATPTRVLVIPMSNNNTQTSLVVATKLRENDVSTQVSFGDNKPKKSLAYANKLDIPFVVLIGDDEESQKKYTLKKMLTGDQEQLSIEELINKLKI